MSGSVSFKSDAFFGVNRFAGITYDACDMDITLCGICWGAGSGQDRGNWTEFGVGRVRRLTMTYGTEDWGGTSLSLPQSRCM